jgi:hypothetical protein
VCGWLQVTGLRRQGSHAPRGLTEDMVGTIIPLKFLEVDQVCTAGPSGAHDAEGDVLAGCRRRTVWWCRTGGPWWRTRCASSTPARS